MSPAPDLARTTAAGLSAGLRKKAFSAVELCEASIARIEALDPKINAVVVRDFDRALNDARIADMAIARGDIKALTGIPMTVKESFDLRGYPTTWGMTDHIEHRAREDALAVQRVKAAGAVVLGKTNVPPGLSDLQTTNPIYGRTNNPHDVTRTPGGSSGGSAAAVAMGFSALELGSDIGGSVRLPAAMCGVFGHKPSYGVVPWAGHMFGGLVSAPTPLWVIGPFARSAQDLATLLQVVAGPDAEQPANKLVLPMPRHGSLRSFRVCVLEHPLIRADKDIQGAIDALADHLTREGASVARQSSLLPDMTASWKTYQALLHTVMTRGAAPGGRPPISAHEWLDHLDAQLRLRRQWADFFRHFDVVLCPVFSTPAFAHTDEPDWRKRPLTIDGEAAKFGDQLIWASMAAVAQLPSTVIPLGVNAEGLPLACQAMGPYLEDLTTIAFAGMVAHEVVTPRLAQ